MLAQVARKAWTRQTASGALDETFDAFRHREAQAATRSPQIPEGFTLRTAPRRCFDDLLAHFQAIDGDTGAALDTLNEPNELRQIRRTIQETAKEKGVGPEYVSRICLNQCGRLSPETMPQAVAVLTALKKMQPKTNRRFALP